MRIHYRQIKPVESLLYREIRLESLKLHPIEFGSSFEEQSRLPKLHFEKAIEEPVDERFIIGAFEEDKLIGICGFLPFALNTLHKWERNRTGTIVQVYVKPDFRGRKIGLGLVRVVIRDAFRIKRITQIVLGVRQGNQSAIQVYREAGFKEYSSASGDAGANQEGLWMILQRDG